MRASPRAQGSFRTMKSLIERCMIQKCTWPRNGAWCSGRIRMIMTRRLATRRQTTSNYTGSWNSDGVMPSSQLIECTCKDWDYYWTAKRNKEIGSVTSVTVTGQMMMTSHMVTDGHLPSIKTLYRLLVLLLLQHYFSQGSAHYRNDQHQMRCCYMQTWKMPKCMQNTFIF